MGQPLSRATRCRARAPSPKAAHAASRASRTCAAWPHAGLHQRRDVRIGPRKQIAVIRLQPRFELPARATDRRPAGDRIFESGSKPAAITDVSTSVQRMRAIAISLAPAVPPNFVTNPTAPKFTPSRDLVPRSSLCHRRASRTREGDFHLMQLAGQSRVGRREESRRQIGRRPRTAQQLASWPESASAGLKARATFHGAAASKNCNRSGCPRRYSTQMASMARWPAKCAACACRIKKSDRDPSHDMRQVTTEVAENRPRFASDRGHAIGCESLLQAFDRLVELRIGQRRVLGSRPRPSWRR